MEATSPAEEAESQAIVRVLAVVLERLVSANSCIEVEATAPPQEQTHFHAQRAPAIGILQYLERIQKYASCSKECFILALIYIDRLIQKNNFLLTELNVHRVVITAILLAAKFFDDAYYNNAYYAKVGGVHVTEMNNLETQFLFKIDFSLRVLPEVFDKYNAELISHSSALGIERIEHCTDEELLRVPSVREIKLAANMNCMAPQEAPQVQQQTHPVIMYPDSVTPSAATGAADVGTYHRSVTGSTAASSASAQPHVHYENQQYQQQQQLQQQAESALDPLLFPFPIVPQVISQDNVGGSTLSSHQYAASNTSQQAQGMMASASAAPPPQGQVYTSQQHQQLQSEFDHLAMYHTNNSSNSAASTAPMDGISTQSNNYPIQQATTQAPAVYTQRTDYFSNSCAAQHNTTNTQPMSIRTYPEITPSPPPQQGSYPPHEEGAAPMYNIHLASNAMGTSSPYQQQQQHHTHHHYHPNQGVDSAGIALDLHNHHQKQHQLISRPIAIGGGDHHPFSQDNTSSWSYSILSTSGNRRG